MTWHEGFPSVSTTASVRSGSAEQSLHGIAVERQKEHTGRDSLLGDGEESVRGGGGANGVDRNLEGAVRAILESDCATRQGVSFKQLGQCEE